MTWALTHLRLILVLTAMVIAFALGAGAASFVRNAHWQKKWDAEQLRIKDEKLDAADALKAEQVMTDAFAAALDTRQAAQEINQKTIEKEAADETRAQVVYRECKPTAKLVRSITAAVDNR